MINRLGPVAGAEAVDQRGRLLIAGYAVKRLSASLSPRDRRESGRAVPGGAHRARSALSASTGESTVAARAARETPGVLGRNGEAPSDRSLGASVYRPSPLVGDERKMAPHSGRHHESASERPPRAARVARGFAAGALGSCSPAPRQSGTNVEARPGGMVMGRPALHSASRRPARPRNGHRGRANRAVG